MENNDRILTLENIMLAVNQSCSCGGHGPDDLEVCPACEVWHRLMGRVIKRETETNIAAKEFCEKHRMESVL